VLDDVATVSAVALAVVFLWSSVAKFRTPAGTAGQFAELGIPLPRISARVVPAAELGVCVLLLILPGWGGVVAFAVLASFTTLLAGVVRSGRPVACACFGGSADDPVTKAHLIRNAVLMAMTIPVMTLDHLTLIG
jgi:uncharacterized membrane protein YphA (DoxX/SURF4 family)